MQVPLDVALEYNFHYGKGKPTRQRRIAARFCGLCRAVSGGFESSQ
jgi:hypothetical protein